MRKWILGLMIVIALVAVVLWRPLPTRSSTTILTGTIKDAQGNPINGILILQLPVPAQDTTTSVAVANTPISFRLVNGVITGSTPLFDVANLQPQNLYYIARAYDTSGTLVFTGNYPVTGATFNLGAAVPTSVTTSNISFINPANTAAANTWSLQQTFIGGLVSTSGISVTGVTTLYGGITQNVQAFTASGTFTIPTNVRSVKVTAVGAGGGGGGAAANSSGQGGGGGGTAIRWLSGLTPGNTITITIGTGGAGGAAGANPGAAGTSTLVASGTQPVVPTINAGGGGGGGSGNAASTGGGTSAGGDVNLVGNAGNTAVSAGATLNVNGSAGSPSILGGVGLGSSLAGGNAPPNTGGGGAGGAATFAGGNGGSGMVIIEWVI